MNIEKSKYRIGLWLVYLSGVVILEAFVNPQKEVLEAGLTGNQLV
jgi:hypothetical protein